MNAHINYDLPLALVATCTELNTEPAAGTHHADTSRSTRCLDAAEQSVRRDFLPSGLVEVDHHVGGVATIVANWSINSARDAAWDTPLRYGMSATGTWRPARQPAQRCPLTTSVERLTAGSSE